MPTKSLSQWLDFISKAHPSEIEMGLERVKSVFKKLLAFNSQEKKYSPKVVLVAGTNGKGSTIAMIESGLLALGHKVGVYTSPHILLYNERVRINAEDVSDAELITSFERVEIAREKTPLTYFEYGTLAALDILLSKNLDVLLLEIGLGGRLDAVNIVEPDLSIITSVGLDHIDWLGDTVDKIGLEKAGILRPKGLFIGGEFLPDSVQNKSQELLCQSLVCRHDFNVFNHEGQQNSQLVHLGKGQVFKGFPTLLLPENNLLIALQATLCIFELMNPDKQFLQESYELIIGAIESVHIPGRLEHVVKTDKHDVFLDVGHNPHAAIYLKDFLMQYASSDAFVQVVYSSLADKDALGVLRNLSPVVDRCLLTQLNCHRAIPLQELSVLANKSGLKCIETYSNVNDAFMHALNYPQLLGGSDKKYKGKVVTLIFGSFFMVEAAKHFLETYD